MGHVGRAASRAAVRHREAGFFDDARSRGCPRSGRSPPVVLGELVPSNPGGGAGSWFLVPPVVSAGSAAGGVDPSGLAVASATPFWPGRAFRVASGPVGRGRG
ncbi:hypothetical protein CcI156_18135 [Frankia sp. CcI156]|nr:hypothetical protein Manayef4_10500 [Frankia sp. CgIM4]OHV51753.1 hypothetical protein CgIS1_18060 [Frankia sp. CgIS1]ONH23578.1 hypothetical protein CcI156_18135 [Frankia sp. CcI156]